MHGWLVIDKPIGPGSTGIVAAVKRALREGGYPKVKVGHGGTLDPLASGVLPVAIGEATKLAGRMLDADKVYEFTIAFGVETDTLDLEGTAVATSDQRPTLAEIKAVLARFTGPIEQVPPAYSAIKVDGKRAYRRARAGEEMAIPARKVTVHALKILPQRGRGTKRSLVEGLAQTSEQLITRSQASEQPLHQATPDGCSAAAARSPMGGCRLPPAADSQAGGLATRPSPGAWLTCSPPPLQNAGEDLEEITLTARVSKGTYIRSLARDIALALESRGHVTMLRRTRAGPFALEMAISLDKLAGAAKARNLERHLLPLTAGLDDIPALSVTPDQARALRQGRKLIGIAAKPGLHLATDAHVPVALVELGEGELRVVRGFNLNE
jgi:tRNA pseudouridine55 synthase